MARTICINDQKTELKSRDHLISLMENLLTQDYLEIWIAGQKTCVLCIMTNPQSAFLMYLRYEGDVGFRSNNKIGNENNSQEFKLSNGQIDLYPEKWLVDKDEVMPALLTYFDSEDMDKNIDWILGE